MVSVQVGEGSAKSLKLESDSHFQACLAEWALGNYEVALEEIRLARDCRTKARELEASQ